jgi:hypothetical protein
MSASPGVGVFTPDLRFEWVRGYIGTDPEDGSVECGPGTFYPLEVTNDQLAEIMYRVRDSVLTGYLVASGGYYDGATYGVTSGTPEKLVVSNAFSYQPDPEYDPEYQFVYSARGYRTRDPDGNDDYFGDAYEIDTDIPDGLGGNYYDVGDSERAMWISKSTNVKFNNQTENFFWDSDFKTGFSHHFSSGRLEELWSDTEVLIDELPTIYMTYLAYDGEPFGAVPTIINFNGRVAWIDDNESGNPFDPENRRFVGFQFNNIANFGDTNYLTTVSFGAEYLTDTGRTIILALASGTVSCPIYAYGSYDATWSGGFTLTPTKWWPYAKGSPAEPVWDAETGERL